MSERRMSRSKTRERAATETKYDQVVRAKEIRNKRMAEGRVIVTGKDLPWELNRQGRIKYFLTDKSDDVAAPGWLVFQQEIQKHSGMHRHQGGTFIFVLRGKGYSIVNEVRHDWEAGDLTILPMVPGGVAHQHFNLDPDVPALWMRVAYTPNKRLVVANWIEQFIVNPEWADKKRIREQKAAPMVNHARTTSQDDSARGNTLFDALLRLRDEQREQVQRARMVIQGKSLPLEINPMGLFRWYVHPDMKDVGCRAQIFYVQEIPAGSRSGKQLHQGGRFHYVLEGKGSTVIDGVCHDWQENQIILLPLKSHGVVHQHFNSDPNKPARLLVSEPNWVHVWGVDLGSGFEMLEPAPEYQG
jgi:mannose-6-phosphate isomerase-like protein (cupin superfamily)